MKDRISVVRALFDRYVEQAYPSPERVVEFLSSKKKLTIYHGVDPTAPKLHLGHSTNYFFLRGLQEIGHKIILLIGDFTAQIGDPGGKSATRKPLTKIEVLQNGKTYKQQAGKILDFSTKRNPAVLKFNSQWLEKLSLKDVIQLASHFTVNQMLARDMFRERRLSNREIYLHEFLYPLMQGYDSVAMDVDGEVGGSDQTFNMLIGRDLMKTLKKKEKFVITTPLLVNPKTGKKLMSKSEGGYIGLDDNPEDMYGKVMALDDEVVFACFRLCTKVPLAQIQELEGKARKDIFSMRDAKAFLARENVRMYHGENAAERAEEEFNRIFRKRQFPSNVPRVAVKAKELSLLDLITKTGLAHSKAEARRLVEQRGVKINGETQENWRATVKIQKGMIVQAGKRRFVEIV